MPCLTRSVLRWGLIGGLALGAATFVLGPQRMMAGFDQVRVSAEGLVDHLVENPVALRRQLQTLAEAYPNRIAEVRGELVEVERQIAQLDRDNEVATRVVSNTTNDLRNLRDMLAEAETHVGKGVPVSIRSNGVRLNVDDAKAEARRISEIRLAFQDRQDSNAHQLKFLGEQRDRLQEILNKLEGEYSTFEDKLAQIDRQIDAIERNERLIEMTKEQQEILASYDKFGKVNSLTQLESKLAQLQAIQDAQLQALSKSGSRHDYEQEAREQLSDESGSQKDPFQGIEIQPSTSSEPAAKATSADGRSIAYLDPIVIDRHSN